LRVIGRATQGVRLINLKETDEIAAVTKVDVEDAVAEIEETAENGSVDNSAAPSATNENTDETSPTEN
ncbi:MAG TPA: DNA gyrase C-terminal beta-propeller domain-containing protein, partial [Bacteroidia bacterium]|nr:DNA gyrase C-terminal beta-propeller domain-containing protein [Bacteroidia bacterium]